MPINPDAVGATGAPIRHSWDVRDVLLYALGVGAGAADPLQELQFTTENSQNTDLVVLPTMAVVLGVGGAGAFGSVGSFNPAMLVHGEQAVTVHEPIPTKGEVETVGTITGIYDKGKGAVIEVTSTSTDVATGRPLFTNVMSAFIRGEGGFGGERGPSGPKNVAPDRDPDHSCTYATRTDQALLYRLSGDRNPLHSDPAFAAFGGFDRPILHGLCTYGFTGRALLHLLCGSDPARFWSMEGRFSSPVLPGESLTIEAWGVGAGEAVFRTRGDDGRVVLDAGRLTYRSEGGT
jgi:acyl dehydratase